MRIISRIFGHSQNQIIELLEASISQLKAGIFAKLSKKYIMVYGKEKGELLSAGIINNAFLENQGNKKAEIFFQDNLSLIEKESLNISKNTEINRAFSYLYAAETIYQAFITKELLSNRSRELGERATLLSINIPNTYDICGSNNIHECVIAIMEYASKFFNDNK